MYWKSVQLLVYAGNIDTIGRTKRDITAAFSTIEWKSTEMGLAVNEGKTKYMLLAGRVKKQNKKHTFLRQTVRFKKYIFEKGSLCSTTYLSYIA